MHTPTFQEETCAILEILPLLQREMEQIVQQVACSGDGSCPEITDVNAVRQKNHKPNDGEKQQRTNKKEEQHCWNCKEFTHWKSQCPKLNRKPCKTCQGTGIWKPPQNQTNVSYGSFPYSMLRLRCRERSESAAQFPIHFNEIALHQVRFLAGQPRPHATLR